MSDPTRYGRKGGDLEPLKDGQYVAWDDYAKLKAENERMLFHADAMARALEGNGFNGAVKLWNEAKEGRDAK